MYTSKSKCRSVVFIHSHHENINIIGGTGPLKSIFRHLNGWIPLIKGPFSMWINFGLNSAQGRHEEHTFFTSSVEKGRFLAHMKQSICVIPEWHSPRWRSLSVNVFNEAQNALVSVSGANLSLPNWHLIEWLKATSSIGHFEILLFLSLVLLW